MTESGLVWIWLPTREDLRWEPRENYLVLGRSGSRAYANNKAHRKNQALLVSGVLHAGSAV